MLMQLGGEGGPGLLAYLDGLLSAGPDQDHHGRHHQQLAGPAEKVDLMPGAEYNCKFRIFFNDQLFNLCILDEYTFVSFVFVWQPGLGLQSYIHNCTAVHGALSESRMPSLQPR